MYSGKKKKYMAAFCIALMLQFFLFTMITAPAVYAEPEEGEAATTEETPATSTGALNLEVKSAILMDAETGQVLYAYNENEARPPASMAKMMTEYLVMEAISKKKIGWNDMVPVSEYAAHVGGSGELLAEGEEYSVEQMFRAMSIYSSNDASVALAEFVAGSESAFADMMNKKAKEIGLSDGAYFLSSTGLSREDLLNKNAPGLGEGETMMSAKDAALLAQRVIKDFPETLEYTKTPISYLVEGDERTKMVNWNWMLEGWAPISKSLKKFAYPGLDGLKTGSTSAAGYCFTGTATRDGMRLISVVMGAETERKRFEETRKLMDYGFNNFELSTVMNAKAEVKKLKTVKITKGVDTKVSVVTGGSVSFILPRGLENPKVTVKATPFKEDKLVAPIKKGDKVGKVKVTYTNGDQKLEKTVDLVAAEDVEKAGWLRLLFRAIGEFFRDLFSGIKNLF